MNRTITASARLLVALAAAAVGLATTGAGATAFTARIDRTSVTRATSAGVACDPSLPLCEETFRCGIPLPPLPGIPTSSTTPCRAQLRVEVAGTGTPGFAVAGTVTIWDRDGCRDFGPGGTKACTDALVPYERDFATVVADDGTWSAWSDPVELDTHQPGPACESLMVDVTARHGTATAELSAMRDFCG